MRRILIVIFLCYLAGGERQAIQDARAAEEQALDADRNVFVFPSTGVRVRDAAVLLGIDNRLLAFRGNLCLYLSKPTVRKEAVLLPDRANPQALDHLAIHFYGTVLHDGGKYRMWYYPVRQIGGPSKLGLGPACYAESDDGISWIKPVLGQVEINGSKQNNALALAQGDVLGVNVMKDEADPNPARRYKMVFQYMPNNYPTLKTAVSADGLAWTLGKDLPQQGFREQMSLFHHNGLYVVCGHTDTKGEGGQPRGRQGFAWVSPNFDDWLVEEAEAFLLPEPPYTTGATGEVWSKPFDQVHVGIGATSFGSVAVGLYGLWHEKGWGEGGTTCDLGLVVSNDGVHFYEPVPGRAYLKADEESLPPVPGKNYPTLLTQGSGILNVGDETRIYYGRWRNTEWPVVGDGLNYYAEVGLATLPRDRWGGLGLAPGANAGSVWSAPITLPQQECRVFLNAASAKAFRIELADERFGLLSEFSGDKSGVCASDAGLDCAVDWPAGKLASLAGKTVRLRIHVAAQPDARLFAVYLKTVE